MYSQTTPYDEYLQNEQIKYPELTLDKIQALKDCLENDTFLPYIPDKKYLAFLHSCYFDVELAKKTVKKYYKFHFEIPQVFGESDPYSEDVDTSYNCLSIGQMPTTNNDKDDRIIYLQFKDQNPELLNFVTLFKYLYMYLEHTLLAYGMCDGIISVINSEGLTWRHVIKIPIGIATKMLKFMETGLPVRLKEIHIINTGSATQMLMKIIMRLANQDLINKIKLHSAGSEEIFNYLPKKIMPIEMGGLGKSHNYYSDELHKNITDMCDIFLGQNEAYNNHMMYLKQQNFEDKD